MNYFKILCFFWVFVILLSRFFMIKMGSYWKKWELEKAYTIKKPKWINLIALFGVLLVVFTWYRVFTTPIAHSWVIAVLISFTLLKVYKMTFQYNKFRKFVVNTLNNPTKWNLINIALVIFALALMCMGIVLY